MQPKDLQTHIIAPICFCFCMFTGAGDENPYSLHTDNYNDLFGPNYMKELSDWSTYQQTLMP